MTLIAEGQLETLVSIDADWGTGGVTAAKHMAREFTGKAVLRLNAM